MATRRLGKQPPRYQFFLNPYQDARFTSCPKCSGKTKQKKLPLVIHVDDAGLVALNKTCRYCPACDLLIAHEDQLEALLAAMFEKRKPEVIGNDYLVVGTLDRPDWKRGTEGQLTLGETIDRLHDFEEVLVFKPLPSWGPSE